MTRDNRRTAPGSGLFRLFWYRLLLRPARGACRLITTLLVRMRQHGIKQFAHALNMLIYTGSAATRHDHCPPQCAGLQWTLRDRLLVHSASHNHLVDLSLRAFACVAAQPSRGSPAGRRWRRPPGVSAFWPTALSHHRIFTGYVFHRHWSGRLPGPFWLRR